MAEFDRSYEEKRSFIRMQINSPVTIEHAGKQYQGICNNLSGDGMQIETQESFAVGTQLAVTIEQKGNNRQPFNALVEVTRTEAKPDESYSIGLAIKEIQ